LTNNKVELHYYMKFKYREIINPDDKEIWKELWAIQSPFGNMALVYADCKKDALDEAFDAGKLDSCVLSEDTEEEGIDYLGNDCIACNISDLIISKVNKEELNRQIDETVFDI